MVDLTRPKLNLPPLNTVQGEGELEVAVGWTLELSSAAV